MRIAFYAPLKPPDHPMPSGDRRVAQLLWEALRGAGHAPFLASRLRSYDGVGDKLRRLPGVEWLALSTGSFDYVLLVRAPDVDHLRDVILDGLQSIPEVQSSQTLLLLDEPPVAGQ